MKKLYHLSTCDTCKRIIKELQPLDGFTLQDIKNDSITSEQLAEMHALSGSYESLFSKRARLFKERNLKEKALTENDYKELILEHYTFLKRPVLINSNKIFIGNSKKTVEAAKLNIHS
ncbi:ArsC/Spx/MgsR family protein [uncultured Maribacter sp.]|uniref:arsenate reductase family protein n=1 Tax=uncultured Maribacter sp. TaxID=431308 RepID=UPI0026194341|nr:ArsC/Spx/MgsR family protein [uncultured Maribacter sp.]